MKPPEATQPAVHHLTDRLFRHESGKIVSILIGIYGARNLQLAEDVVQEALVRALKTWPYGIPDNPSAWLLRTAKNLAIDQLRRETRFREKAASIIGEIENSRPPEVSEPDESEIHDDQLRLMFTCCHPSLPPEARTALALKTLCGFSPAEIASAFLISEVAVSKRLVRAKQKLRDDNVAFHIPGGDELPERLDGVLEIIYLLFNEGHKATHGDEIFRTDICMEAIRLCGILASHPVGNRTRTHALLALMCLTAARLPSRMDADGNLLRLEEQDRSLWDQALIHQGFYHLARSSAGKRISFYHLQAGIAACHASASSDAATDWRRILKLYDSLAELHPSGVISLNRAVAISKVHGPEEALRILETSDDTSKLAGYHLFHVVMGDLEFQLGRNAAAAGHFRNALDLSQTKPERTLIARRLEESVGALS